MLLPDPEESDESDNDEEESDDDDNRRTDSLASMFGASCGIYASSVKNENRSETDENDVEEFQIADEDIEDLNPEEQPSSYPCSQCPELMGSKEALKFHIRMAHRKRDSLV